MRSTQEIIRIIQAIMLTSTLAINGNRPNKDFLAGQHAFVLALCTALGIAPHELEMPTTNQWRPTTINDRY